MSWLSSDHKIMREIMKTDIYVKVVSRDKKKREMDFDVIDAFVLFRSFASKFSRFLPESELSKFNRASGTVSVSPDLARMLSDALAFWKKTDGIFDPSILPVLVREGYGASFGTSDFGKTTEEVIAHNKELLGKLIVDTEKNIVEKPEGLMIDLGGLGKGYIVDCVGEFLAKKYDNFLVDAGGDILTHGENKEENYDYWAIEVETPSQIPLESPVLLTLRERAVATSGVGRRAWINALGKKKHHLIDPKTGQSAITDLFSVTVVDTTTEMAEVWAKVLCILGMERGMVYAQEKKIAALFIAQDGRIVQSEYMDAFRWGVK